MALGRSFGRIAAIAIGLGSLSLGVALADAPPKPATNAPAKKPAPNADAGDRYDPENVTAISQFMETLVKGTEKYNAKDYTAAIDIFKKAIQLNPRNALGPYLLGEAYLATNNLTEAEAAFKTAEELNDPKFPLVRSHVLFALADCYERQKKRDQARTAWQAYAEHAAKLGVDGGAFPGSGAARIKALDDYIKLDKQYEIVRQRIAAEKADAGADGGKPAAPTPKK
jgi:tetratricopeptide (TPR) repeat protein